MTDDLLGGTAVHAAMLTVMRAVGYVHKGGEVNAPGARYSYAGEADLIHALRPAMLEAGLYCYVLKAAVTSRSDFTTGKGRVMQSTVIKQTVRFVHADSGSYIDVETVGEGADSGDKSAPKAMTGAFKYALRQAFCIETGDDPDQHASEERHTAPQQRRPPPTTQAPTQRTAPQPAPGIWPCPQCSKVGIHNERYREGGKAPRFECQTCMRTDRNTGKNWPLGYGWPDDSPPQGWRPHDPPRVREEFAPRAEADDAPGGYHPDDPGWA